MILVYYFIKKCHLRENEDGGNDGSELKNTD